MSYETENTWSFGYEGTSKYLGQDAERDTLFPIAPCGNGPIAGHRATLQGSLHPGRAVRRVLWHSSPALARSVGFPCAQALDSMVLRILAVLPRFYPEGTINRFYPIFSPFWEGKMCRGKKEGKNGVNSFYPGVKMG